MQTEAVGAAVEGLQPSPPKHAPSSKSQNTRRTKAAKHAKLPACEDLGAKHLKNKVLVIAPNLNNLRWVILERKARLFLSILKKNILLPGQQVLYRLRSYKSLCPSAEWRVYVSCWFISSATRLREQSN
jgi:hypothetical protein